MAEKHTQSPSESEKDTKSTNLVEKTKEAVMHSPKHGKETHGTSNDIDESTPVDEVKGPGVFHRIKEELEAVVEAIHPDK